MPMPVESPDLRQAFPSVSLTGQSRTARHYDAHGPTVPLSLGDAKTHPPATT